MTILDVLFFLLGFGALVYGADIFVRGASSIARGFQISPVVIGLTVVAFGTSAPELAVTLEGIYKGSPDLAMGNIIGSNISNILLILGVGACIRSMVVAQTFLKVEIPLLIVVSLVFWGMASDGYLAPWEGLILVAGAIVYTLVAVKSALRERKQVKEEYAKEFGEQDNEKPVGMGKNAFFIVVGLTLLVLGSKGIVASAIKMALFFGMDELTIGLTIVAVGTSLPELATSVIASLKGEGDIAIGNVVGSNLFNILVVGGIGAAVSLQGLPISVEAIGFDLPFMCVVAFALLPAAVSQSRLDRKEGIIFLAFYVAYTVYLVMASTQHEAVASFRWITFYLCGPLIVLVLTALAGRHLYVERTKA